MALKRRRYARSSSEGGVEERVHFPGQVSQTDLPRYYRSADLYLSASHCDGTSISLLEALACGRPALVSDIPGNREWITPGVEGWLFPDGDETALAEAIEQAASNPWRLSQIGEAARRLAERARRLGPEFPPIIQGLRAGAVKIVLKNFPVNFERS